MTAAGDESGRGGMFGGLLGRRQSRNVRPVAAPPPPPAPPPPQQFEPIPEPPGPPPVIEPVAEVQPAPVVAPPHELLPSLAVDPGLNRKRVLIIGAGVRVQNTVLPVLQLLAEEFAVVGVHGRSAEEAGPVASAWGVPVIDRLADVDFGSVDLVTVSLPVQQTLPLLQQLAPHAGSIDLIIDPLMAETPAGFAESLDLLDRFRSVTVAEDTVAMPQFELVRAAIRRGLIGSVRSIVLNNIAHEHHGLALLRSFAGFAPVTEAWRKEIDARSAVTGYRFSEHLQGVTIGPYRHDTAGGLTIGGDAGWITEFPIDRQLSAGAPVHVLRRRHEGGQLVGFELDVAGGPAERVDVAELATLRGLRFADKSDLNLLRACGLARVFRSAVGHNPTDLVARGEPVYSARQALYDALASRRIERGMSWIDPMGLLVTAAPTAPSRLRAKQESSLKNAALAAKDLPPEAQVVVPRGAAVQARAATRDGSHFRLWGAQLDGAELADEDWFVFVGHWETMPEPAPQPPAAAGQNEKGPGAERSV